jgi:hypothetical protein
MASTKTRKNKGSFLSPSAVPLTPPGDHFGMGGRPAIYRPKGKQWSVRMTNAGRDRLDQLRKKTGQSRSDYMEFLVRRDDSQAADFPPLE